MVGAVLPASTVGIAEPNRLPAGKGWDVDPEKPPAIVVGVLLPNRLGDEAADVFAPNTLEGATGAEAAPKELANPEPIAGGALAVVAGAAPPNEKPPGAAAELEVTPKAGAADTTGAIAPKLKALLAADEAAVATKGEGDAEAPGSLAAA